MAAPAMSPVSQRGAWHSHTEVCLQTLPCIDSLSQCSPSPWPLDPAGTTRAADGHAIASLAQECLQDKGNNTAKSSGTWLHALLSTNTQVGYKVMFSKGATGPANTITPPLGQDDPSCLQQVSWQDKPQGQHDGHQLVLARDLIPAGLCPP